MLVTCRLAVGVAVDVAVGGRPMYIRQFAISILNTHIVPPQTPKAASKLRPAVPSFWGRRIRARWKTSTRL